MQRQRFEYKYVINEDTAGLLREYLSSHLEFDEASVGKPNYSYRVNSIYLDSKGLYTFWDWVGANRNRFKLRMRYYDVREDSPVFLEIKRRVSNCILKQRCGIRKSGVSYIQVGQAPPHEEILTRDPKGYVALQRFIGMVSQLRAEPKSLVTYLREAYCHPVNNNIRVTMDREVRITPRKSGDFKLDLDHYVQPFGNEVILELKFNNRFPDWLGQMTRRFNLTRGAAAKYCEGMAALWNPQLGSRQCMIYRNSSSQPPLETVQAASF